MAIETADPALDAAHWEDAEDEKAAEHERRKDLALHNLREAFVEGLQWGPEHQLDLPTGMAKRLTRDAIYELMDADCAGLVNRAICLLAQIRDPLAADMTRELATVWADAAISEWAP